MRILVLLLLAGCSDPPCHSELSGNFAGSSAAASDCATLTQSMGDWLLGITTPISSDKGALQISVDLGAAPASGSFSSETLMTWSAVIAAGNNCLYSAASDAVPTGSFTLSLTAVQGLDGSQPSAHGKLSVVQYVHAPVAVDCGPGDVENVDVTF